MGYIEVQIPISVSGAEANMIASLHHIAASEETEQQRAATEKHFCVGAGRSHVFTLDGGALKETAHFHATLGPHRCSLASLLQLVDPATKACGGNRTTQGWIRVRCRKKKRAESVFSFSSSCQTGSARPSQTNVRWLIPETPTSTLAAEKQHTNLRSCMRVHRPCGQV